MLILNMLWRFVSSSASFELRRDCHLGCRNYETQ